MRRITSSNDGASPPLLFADRDGFDRDFIFGHFVNYRNGRNAGPFVGHVPSNIAKQLVSGP